MQGFHADIDLHGQQVYLSFHMADLTAAPQACCAPLLSKLPLLTVRTHKVTTTPISPVIFSPPSKLAHFQEL